MNSILSHFLQLRTDYPHLAALVLCLVKSSLIVGSTLLLAGVLGRRSALTRSWAWRGAIIGLLGLAFWEVLPSPWNSLRPAWRVSLEASVAKPPPPRYSPLVKSSVQTRTEQSSSSVSDRNKVDLASNALRVFESNVSDVYRVGVALLSFWYAIRVVAGVWWLRRSARPIPPRLQEVAQKAAAALNLRHPCTTALCPRLTTPLLAGWVRSTIFLPDGSLDWTDAKLEAVFIHELSHWRRHDGWWQMLGALTTCLWWWQPLAWFAANALKLTAEQAADDAVILRQKDASSYAQTLVEIAASFAEGRRPVGVAMIGRSSLETRVRSLLRDNPWRGRHGRLGMALTLALTGVFLGAGGLYLRSAETPPASPASRPTPTPKPDTFAPVPSAGAAKGRVVNAQGQPVAGASIQPYTEVRGDTHRYSAVDHEKTHTDPEGRFSYAVPGYSAVGVMVVARGYARRHAIIPYDDTSHDVVLGPGVEVSGRLLKDGLPLPGIEVGIAQVGRGAEDFLDEIVAKTDGEGRFVLPDVAPNEDYEIHAKRDSLHALGATAPRRVRVGEPGTTVNLDDLTVEPGVVVTGRIMLPDGSLPDPEYYGTYPDGRRERETNRSVQLHVWRESAYDLQYIDLGPNLRFALPALAGEKLELTAWVPGYKLRCTDRHSEAVVEVAPGIKPVEMVYDPESDEAKARTRHPVFAPPSTPTPTPPSVEQLAADAKAVQDNAAKLAAQPHRTEAQWREQFAKVQVGMTRDEVYALLPNKTVSIDYLQRDEYDEKTVHTSFYALDGEFAVALTFDFKGDEAWNAAGQPSPRPEADENHLIKPPVLMRHDKMPNKDNEVQLDRSKLVDAPPQPAAARSLAAKAIEVHATVSTEVSPIPETKNFTLQNTAIPNVEPTTPPKDASRSRPSDWPARPFEICRVFTEPLPNTQPEVHQNGRDGEKNTYYVEKKPVIDESAIQSITASNAGGQHGIIIRLTPEAGQRFAEFERQNTGQRAEIFCKGWPIETYIIANPTSPEIVLQSNFVPWLRSMILSANAKVAAAS